MAGATPLPLLRIRPLSSSSSSSASSSSSSSSSSTQCFLQHLRSRESRFRCCGTPERTKPKQKPNCRTETPTSFPPDTSSSKLGSFNSRATPFSIGRIWEDLRVDDVVLEIASIALPAVLALAADPLTSLVDTAFVGHVGSVELAAVGVSVSVFNLVSKLFNVPLLNITTSFVAEEKALDGDKSKAENNNDQVVDGVDRQGKKFLPAVSTSLILAAGIGIVEAVMLFLGSGVFVDTMGIVLGSPMRIPSEQFLRLRALGAPAIVTALAAQGTFRGFLDTKTPLYAVVVGNLLNAILDPILMFVFHLGIEGAAVATVIADYVIVSILLWKLNDEVIIVPSDVDWGKIVQYLRSGALLIVRTIAVVGTVTLSTSMAARRGPIPMAGHQICLQVWLAVSLMNDALALAGQALLASEYTKGNYSHSRTIIYRVLQIGLITGCTLAVVLFIGFDSFCGLFTTDVAVLDIARSGTLFVTASQPINAIAFVLDGLYYGVSDFGYAAYSMLLVGFTSSFLLIALAPSFGLSGVWTGLFIFMVLRVVAGFWRLGSKEGPWKRIWSEVDVNTTEE